MTRSEIEAFLAVVRCGTLSAAAEKLYITQPALSRRIKALETELGYSLLRRNKGRRGAQLTEEGRSFLTLAQKWMQLLGEIDRLPAERNLLRISSIGSLNCTLLPDIYRTFLAEQPGCGLQLSTQHSEECYELMGKGAVDAGFITNPRYHRQVLTIPLFQEPMVLLCRQGSRFAPARRPQDLPAEQEVRLPWTAEFDRWHDYWFGSASPCIVTDEMTLLQVFLTSFDCFCFAPLSLAQYVCRQGAFQFSTLDGGPPARTIYLLRHSDVHSPSLTSFFTCLHRELLRCSDLTVLSEQF